MWGRKCAMKGLFMPVPLRSLERRAKLWLVVFTKPMGSVNMSSWLETMGECSLLLKIHFLITFQLFFLDSKFPLDKSAVIKPNWQSHFLWIGALLHSNGKKSETAPLQGHGYTQLEEPAGKLAWMPVSAHTCVHSENIEEEVLINPVAAKKYLHLLTMFLLINGWLCTGM